MGDHLSENPKRALLYVVFSVYLTFWYAVTSRRPFGTNVFEGEWDLLVVLDACRVDTLREVADEYAFLDEVDTRWSAGSQSAEWLAATFTEAYLPEIRETEYISSNGYSESVLERHNFPPANNTTPLDVASWSVVDAGELAAHRTVWEHSHDDTYRVVLPEAMTDYAIAAGRESDVERRIVHYTQPHLPYAGRAFEDGREPTELERRGYELLETGQSDREEIYDAYRATLRWALDEVEVLLENTEAERVVITADHGEAFGEGLAYGHPEGFVHPVVRKVPWVETSATDDRTREPSVEAADDEIDVEEHLRDLGYR